MAWRAIPGPLSKRKRRLDSLEAAQGAPRDPRRDSRGLGREDPLEKEMATHSSILAWRIPWTEEPGQLPSFPSQPEGKIGLPRANPRGRPILEWVAISFSRKISIDDQNSTKSVQVCF